MESIAKSIHEGDETRITDRRIEAGAVNYLADFPFPS